MKVNKFVVIAIVLIGIILALMASSYSSSSGNGNELYITSDKVASSPKGLVLDDYSLQQLFNVSSNYSQLYNGAIVIQHDIDFDVVGTYNIKFIASYQEVLCFDDKDDADGNGTGKKNDDSAVVGLYCQNNADDNEQNDNDTYKYIDKQKVQTAKLKIVESEPVVTIVGDSSKADYEHISYNNQQLIELFNVKVIGSENSDIQVSHNIDFETPGNYQVTFSADGQALVADYEVIDLLPTLKTVDVLTIFKGQTVDYLNDYQVNAQEFVDYDLNDYVKIHDSHIDYDIIGSYQVKITVSDHEGNVVIKTVALNITENPTLSAKDYVSKPVGREYTKEELIQIFNLTANYAYKLEDMEVTHSIDFNQIGEYEVTFTDRSNNVSVTATLKLVTQALKSFKIEKICTNKNDKLTTEDYIAEYTKQIGPITDQTIIDTLQIDDSKVVYGETGTYQVSILATNYEGEQINQVFSLCITAEDEEEPVTEEDEEEAISDGVICDNTRLNTKVKSVTLRQSEEVDNQKLINLFGQPSDVTVVSSVIPNTIGQYQVLFEDGECSFLGTVNIEEAIDITNVRSLRKFLKDNNLNNIDSDAINTGTYHLTTIDEESGDEHMMTINYTLTSTGLGFGLLIALGVLVLILIGIIMIIRRAFN